jgi:diketogulonate reductase-like aldo/keto reductase
MTNAQNLAIPEIKLNSGTSIPQVGFGLWKVQDEDECKTSIENAIESGYRHFDSAQIYGNEKFLGEVLDASDISRDEVFITTKLWNENQADEVSLSSFEKSLENLKTDYVDLFLIHFPVSETRELAWKTLEKIFESGKAKAVGVSNYTISHLEKLLANCEIVPAVNQVELHVFLQQRELREYCDEKGIIIEAYSPLAHGNGLDNAELIDIGDQYEKSSAQVMLRWCVQNNLVVLPKSVTKERISSNIDIYDFELSASDLDRIEKLEKNFRTCWDPTDVV